MHPAARPLPCSAWTPATLWEAQRGWAAELVGAPGSWARVVAPEPNSSPQVVSLCQATASLALVSSPASASGL